MTTITTITTADGGGGGGGGEEKRWNLACLCIEIIISSDVT